MSLATGSGPLSSTPAGTFVPPVGRLDAYVEPHRRRIQAFVDETAVIDTEQALLIHRRDRPGVFAFLPGDVHGVETQPASEAAGYVTVPWGAVDRWVEEGRELVNYPPNPYHRVDCRPGDRRLHVTAAGVVIVDTTETMTVFETGLPPVLYVAWDRVRVGVLVPSGRRSYCNYKGWATYYSALVAGVSVDDAAWRYESPLPEAVELADMVSFDLQRCVVDAAIPGG